MGRTGGKGKKGGKEGMRPTSKARGGRGRGKGMEERGREG